MEGIRTYIAAAFVFLLTAAGVYAWLFSGVMSRDDFIAYVLAVLGLVGPAVAAFLRAAMAPKDGAQE